MKQSKHLISLMFPEPSFEPGGTSLDSLIDYRETFPAYYAIFRDCFSKISKAVLIGCCGLRNEVGGRYVREFEPSYRKMLSQIVARSLSTPVHAHLDIPHTKGTQRELSQCIDALEKLIDTSNVVEELSKDVFEQIVKNVDNADVLSLVQARVERCLAAYPEFVDEFIRENWFDLQNLETPNEFAKWCLSEFQLPTFQGEYLDETRWNGVLSFGDGTSLHGLFVSGRLVGKGKEKFGRRIIYQGDFKDGLYHGQGTLKDLSDGAKYVGEFKLGKPDGWGVSSREGEIYEGGFKEGKPHGKGSCNTSVRNWSASYKGEMKDGLRHGTGEFTDKTGRSYVGKWNRDKMHGKGTLSDADGIIFEGKFHHEENWLNPYEGYERIKSW